MSKTPKRLRFREGLTANIWERRSDLKGFLFRVALHLQWESIAIRNDDGSYTGLTVEVYKDLERALNLTHKFVEAEDHNYGSIIENETFNGMVGMLQNNEADIVAADLSITHERSRQIDFLKELLFNVPHLYAMNQKRTLCDDIQF